MRVTRNRTNPGFSAKAVQIGIACLLLAVTTAAWGGQDARQYKFDIGAAPFSRALREFSQQSGLQVLYLPGSEAEATIIVGPISGEYTAEEAMLVLVRPLGARFTWLNERTIAIESPDVRRRFR
jgi:iron complex outermembrane recepter protein